MRSERDKPKPIKGMKIKYGGVTYDNIISVNRGYEYSSFSYLDERGNLCGISLDGGNMSFEILTET